MAKNFKGKAQRPPLSVVDKVIYGVAILLPIALSFWVFMIFAETLPQWLAYRDPYVIACWNDGFLWGLPLFTFIAFLCMLPVFGAEKRQPIFGNKRYKAPAFSHTIKVHPLCSREFWLELSDSNHQRIKKTCNWLLLGLIGCLLLAIIGLFPRYVLTSQRTVIRYNALNYPAESYSIYDTQKLVLQAYHVRDDGRDDWYFSMKFVFDTNKDIAYSFRPGYFDHMTREEALQQMLRLKDNLFSGKCEILGTDLVDDVIRDQEYTDAEAKLLYQLFDLPT